MPKRDFDIKSILDIPRWEKVQDQLAKLTGTAIISIDFKVSPVYPAIEYIKTHLDKKLTMSEMAELCRISQSYFSRMFTTTVGENFTNYANRQKTQRAKKLLRDTDKSITQISTELGYGDVSTFIRLFKRFEGTTPQVYRQYRYK